MSLVTGAGAVMPALKRRCSRAMFFWAYVPRAFRVFISALIGAVTSPRKFVSLVIFCVRFGKSDGGAGAAGSIDGFRGSLLIMITFTSTFSMFLVGDRHQALILVAISYAAIAPEFSK